MLLLYENSKTFLNIYFYHEYGFARNVRMGLRETPGPGLGGGGLSIRCPQAVALASFLKFINTALS
jgi:hypothetical protein